MGVRSRGHVVLPAVLACVALAGCGGEQASPVGRPTGTITLPASTPSASGATSSAGLDALALVERVRTVVRATSSVAVRGTVASTSGRTAVDLAVHKDGASGTVSADGVAVEVRRVDDDLYVRSGDPAAYERWAPGRGLVGRWLQVDSADPRLAGLAELTTLSTVRDWSLGALLTERLPDATVEGRPALVVQNPRTGATLSVSASGDPLPLAFRRTEGEVRGELTYRAWDAPVRVEVPAPAEVTVLSTTPTD